jgi:hypothetical protein
MYLDYWMIAAVIFSFGACHWISRVQGIQEGAVTTLRLLHEEKIINVSDEGKVSRYSTWNQKPKRKRRNKNADL